MFSPIAIAFDEDGRIWVCEFNTYMPNVEGEGEEVPRSNIVILEDSDGDGQIDTRKVFIENVVLPRAIAFVEGGIFYSDHTQLYFAEVLAGDKLGRHEVVDPSYAAGGNVEHKANGMLYSLDNWYYNAKSDRKYKTLPLEADIPAGGEEIYRNDSWKLVRAATRHRGQWGISMDDQGRLFYNGNSSPATGEALRPDVLTQNPEFDLDVEVAAIGSTRVYPARINPGVNRGYVGRDTLIEDGPDAGKLRSFTAAGGNVVYRGDNYPPQFYGMSVTPEPAGNLISARRIVDGDVALSGEPIYPESEILASTDERFRPVNLVTAPDGTLYVVDMYHGIIAHELFITRYLRRQIKARDLDKSNNTMGRIYRLRWEDNPAGAKPQLRGQPVEEWVRHLDNANGWWRDTARRRIVQSQDATLAPALLTKLETTEDPVGRINILWALEGLDQITLPIVRLALEDDDPRVRAAAMSISATVPEADHPALLEIMRVYALRDLGMAREGILAAGRLDRPETVKVVADVLDAFGGQPYIYKAALSSLGPRAQDLAARLDRNRHAEFFELMEQSRRQQVGRSGRDGLTGEDLAAFEAGRDLYHGHASCAGCHGSQGEGIENMGPPLASSEWVIEAPDRLIKIMLHGMVGPVTVKGVVYDPGMMMPGLGENEDFTDTQLAAIATYIRNDWGNAADPIAEDLISGVRKATLGREDPYEAKDLN